MVKFGDHLKLKIRRGAQILVLQSHSEVVKMSSILFFYSKKALEQNLQLKSQVVEKPLKTNSSKNSFKDQLSLKIARFLELRDFKLFKQIVLIDLLLGPFYFFGSSIW